MKTIFNSLFSKIAGNKLQSNLCLGVYNFIQVFLQGSINFTNINILNWMGNFSCEFLLSIMDLSQLKKAFKRSMKDWPALSIAPTLD